MTAYETPHATTARHTAEAQERLVARLRRQIDVLEAANLNLLAENDRLRIALAIPAGANLVDWCKQLYRDWESAENALDEIRRIVGISDGAGSVE